MLRHVCIEVKNMPVELVAAFYVEHFGMKIVYNNTEQWELKPGFDVTLRIVKLKMKGTRTLLELVQQAELWPSHIALEVDEFPEKVQLIAPRRLDADHKGIEVKFCADPALNMIELVRRIK